MSTKEDDIFSVLSLSPDVSPRAVRKRCQDLMLQLHPDKNGGKREQKFDKVAEIWKEISSQADLAAFINREKAKLKTFGGQSGAMTSGSDIKLSSDMSKVFIEFDGSDVEAYVYHCRCGGVYILTVDTVEESAFVEKWHVECDTCSLMLKVAR